MPILEKILGIAFILGILSLFMPWYKENDVWGTKGDQFTGLTGPLFLIGVIILTINLIGFYIYIKDRILHKEITLKLPENLILLSAGAITILFNVIIYSIYFHTKFRVYDVRKEVKFGMFLSFLCAAIIILISYVKNRRQEEGNAYIIEDNADKDIPNNYNIQKRQSNLNPENNYKYGKTINLNSEPTKEFRDNASQEKEVINLKMNI